MFTFVYLCLLCLNLFSAVDICLVKPLSTSAVVVDG